MKTIIKKSTPFILLVIFTFFNQSVNAQFLKKLKQRVQEAAEETVIGKSEEKAAEKTGEGVDKILNINFNNIFNKKTTISNFDPSMLPESYDFEWKYNLQMQTKDGIINMIYYLKPEAKYFGVKPEMEQASAMGDMFMVMDIEHNINIILMDMGDKKMANPMSLANDIDIENEDESLADKYSFEEIGSKEILGYECQGFRMENDEVEMIIYATMDAPVSFSQIYGVDTKNMPKGFNPKWLDKIENSLVMEMEYTDKNKKKNTAKMTCVALNEKSISINISDYEFMNLNIPTGEE